jgi:outer membrane receptor protein involved in Fe transport
MKNHSLAGSFPPYARQALYGAAVAVVCAQAVAQEKLQEVVVTAERREENIQNVPIAVTALTGATLQAKGVTDIHALSNITPNVNLDAGSPFSGDRSVLSASIRGIGQDDFAFNLDPGVGVYLDGVYLARTIGANQNLLDVDRIEILKGPQGTLFGANTIGGAISIVTHTPGTTPRFTAEATGGRFNRRDFAFTADMPISSTLLSTITVSSQVRDGYQRVIPYPPGSPEAQINYIVDPQSAYPKAGTDSHDSNGGQNLQVIRGKLLWLTSDAVKVTFAGDWSHQNQSAIPNTDAMAIPNALFSGLYNLCISTPVARLNSLNMQPNNQTDLAYISSFDPLIPILFGPGPMSANSTSNIFNVTNGLCAPRANNSGLPFPGGAALGGAGYIGGPPGPMNAASPGYMGSASPRIYWNSAATNTGNIDTTYSTGPSFAKNDAFGVSATLDWDLTPVAHFKSITGYRQIKWNIGIDLDGMPESIQEVTDTQHQYQVSEELQLSGKLFENKLDYVGGLYAFHEAGYVHDFVPFEGILYIYDAANDVDTKTYGTFFHADYRPMDAFGFTLGGRFTWDRKKFTGGQEDLNGFSYKVLGCTPPSAVFNPVPFGPPGGIPNMGGLPCADFVGFPDPSQPLRYFPPGELSQDYNIFTPTVGAQYHVNQDVMAYASWSKGFKAGGWSTRLSLPIKDGNSVAFKPEYSKTAELGLKSEWLNRRLLANAAVFYTNYDNIQLNVQTGASPVYENAGNAKMKGAELEMQSLIGHGLTIGFTGAYIDAYYTYVNPAIGIPQYYDLATGLHFLPPLSAKLPKTPKYKFSLSPTYDFALPNQGSIRLAADFSYTAEMWNDSLNTPQLSRPVTRNLNAAVHYFSPSGTYEFVVGGTNLTDDRYVTVGAVNYAAGEIQAGYNPPREWYATIRAKVGQ